MKTDIKNYIATAADYELPEELKDKFDRTKKLEWITVTYLVTVAVVMLLAMSSSQAMKAAWIEDVVSIFPSVAFLIASRFFNRKSTYQYPYGFHKAFTVAFVAASLALVILGLFIFIDSCISLIKQDHPSIGSIELLGREVWMGWVMIAALLYSFIPAMILGKKKLPVAKELHMKVLLVDAEAQKADWMTAAAGIVGIIGVGFGLWWFDSAAAIFISFSIIKDGIKRTADSMKDLMEELPATYDNKEVHPLMRKLVELCLEQGWVTDVRFRMREHGMVFFGDMFVIPRTEENLMDNIHDLSCKVRELDWKIEDIIIHPVREFPDPGIRITGKVDNGENEDPQ